ncbi:hypothetical protein DFP73DRAFT_546718 [Morchella snyderi]|nr:hypothetical protein DFP73DRAFT_546718 [Morchella snyderi]
MDSLQGLLWIVGIVCMWVCTSCSGGGGHVLYFDRAGAGAGVGVLGAAGHAWLAGYMYIHVAPLDADLNDRTE